MSDNTSNVWNVLTSLHRTIEDYATFAGIGVLPESVYLRVTNSCLAGCLVPLIYDSMLTMQDEVELIWRRKLSAASVIFVMNRVGLVFSVILVILETIDTVRQRLGDKLSQPFISVSVVSFQTSSTWRKQKLFTGVPNPWAPLSCRNFYRLLWQRVRRLIISRT